MSTEDRVDSVMLEDFDGADGLPAGASHRPQASLWKSPLAKAVLGILVVILVLLVAVVALLAKRSGTDGADNCASSASSGSNGSNGTCTQCQDQRTPLIILSFDGFRHDYVDKTSTPNLDAVIAAGVAASSMTPIFPSKTFPNHYTLVTGLYAETHGIVGNTMWDPSTNTTFRISDPAAVTDARWWGGEPIWVTAEKWGRRAATMFWPGSEAPIKGVRPSYYRRFNSSVSDTARIDQLMQWLDLPVSQRPQFLAGYFSDADHAGHNYGPDSSQVIAAIQKLDGIVGYLDQQLKTRNLSDKVNLIIVSDHGMAAQNTNERIYLDDYIDLTKVHIPDWSPVSEIFPLNPADTDALVANLTGVHPNLTVWHKRDVPWRFHFRDNVRIAPVVALCDEGWTIGSRAHFWWSPGAHGFDNQLPDMGATFIARGPDFKKSGRALGRLPNVDVYNLLCYLLRVSPAPNNGTLDMVLPFLQ